MKFTNSFVIACVALATLGCQYQRSTVSEGTASGSLSGRIAEYQTLKNNKALAVSDAGFSAISYGHPDEQKAVAVAMSECQRSNAAFESVSPCRIMYINERLAQ